MRGLRGLVSPSHKRSQRPKCDGPTAARPSVHVCRSGFTSERPGRSHGRARAQCGNGWQLNTHVSLSVCLPVRMSVYLFENRNYCVYALSTCPHVYLIIDSAQDRPPHRKVQKTENYLTIVKYHRFCAGQAGPSSPRIGSRAAKRHPVRKGGACNTSHGRRVYEFTRMHN